MPNLWDEFLKRLVIVSPQDFASWLLSGAIFERVESSELHSQTHQRHVLADIVLRVRVHGEPLILHVEFQSTNDIKMPARLVEYNVIADNKYNLPVCSCVIYLQKGGIIKQPPFIRALPTGREIHRFDYDVIKLWDISSEDMLNSGLPGIFALLPLTRGGTERAVLDQMITVLAADGKYEVIELGFLLASQVISDASEREWLERRMNMLQNDLRDSWAYKKIAQEGLQEGLQKGLQEGLQKGLQEGRQEGMHQVFLSLVESKFPDLLPIAKIKVAELDDLTALQSLILKLSMTASSEEAQEALLTTAKDQRQATTEQTT